MMPDFLESSVNTIHQTEDDSSSSCSATSRTDTASSIDTASYADTLSSILDLPSAATFIDEDPHATAAAKQTQRSLLQNFYRGLEYQKDIGQGAVFRVGLYINRSDNREYAVKHAIRSQSHRTIGNRPTGGIFHALQEIRVTSHEALARHENIIRIFGWDMTIHREPVIIAEYACNRTLRDFLRADKLLTSPACNWNLKRNFALDIAAGLSAIHAADIAHGDIKLDNTLVFPHPRRQWYVKLSDFSHSVLGISTKRITAYPGSGIYNAPGVRKREDYITSDLLPNCETFSFGLLVWELLKDGESFLESDWLGSSTIPSAADNSHNISKEAKIAWLENLPHNNLLDRALAFLGTLRTMTSYTSSSFALVFEHSLKDRSGLRSAMSTITSMLDYEDRYTPPSPPWRGFL
ncbi:kinase-like domain-containing protein [Tricladium varicosporioides]|nr:kinase-like domain-containing protein [Hymenoscyphus varicosporioides]